jgi:hypothetical protein
VNSAAAVAAAAQAVVNAIKKLICHAARPGFAGPRFVVAAAERKNRRIILTIRQTGLFLTEYKINRRERRRKSRLSPGRLELQFQQP